MHIFCIRIMFLSFSHPNRGAPKCVGFRGNNQILVKLRHTKIGASAHLPNIIA